ncbi:phage pre-tape measure protein [Mesorhizobium sp. ORM6]
MSQLETLTIPSDTVTVGDEKLTVYGLGLPHITYIVRHHRTVLADLYTKAISGELPGSVEEIAMGMIDDFAPLAGLVIACGVGEPEQAAKAAKLPFAVQVDALAKISRLTLEGEGGLEKLMENVARAMAATAKLTSLKASTAG